MAIKTLRNLVLVLGDQLDEKCSAFEGFDKEHDAVWMAEVTDESTYVWSHKARIVLFLSAMRHFRQRLEHKGVRVFYYALDDETQYDSFANALTDCVNKHKPKSLIVTEPGEYRVRESLQAFANSKSIPLDIRTDTHFYCTIDDFADHANSRKNLILEFFYRELRKKHDVLMEDGKPASGQWNFDKDNRKTFGKEGPGKMKEPLFFDPDEITQNVINVVETKFKDHPGALKHFRFAVTRTQALKALNHFIKFHLPSFGAYQDAMWTDEPFLHHSILSYALNLKLLNPREVIEEAQNAYRDGHAPIPAVEGFIRQILGWREFVRGIYWMHMPDYVQNNALNAPKPLPSFYWTGETDMHCMQQAIGQTLKYGYAHHIQRLMVTGLFALLYGVNPRKIHEWYLAVYVDAVEWVEMPNTIGMSQYADGGIMATKPYAATGKYINRMSNYCKSCVYKPDESTGDNACPFTTLYWDFLLRNEQTLADNQRMTLQLRNLQRLDKEKRARIARRVTDIQAINRVGNKSKR